MERISIACPVFNGNEKKYLNECIDTGWVSANGRFIDEFQAKFAEFCGVKNGDATSGHGCPGNRAGGRGHYANADLHCNG